jgi:large repetitive protein
MPPSNTNPLGSEILVNSSNQTGEQLIFTPAQRSVAIDQTGDFVVTWTSSDASGYGIYAQRFNASGVAQGTAIAVNTTTLNDQLSSAVAMDNGGNFVVTWQSNHSGFNDVYAQRYNSAGVAQGSEFRVNATTSGEQRSSNVAMDASGDFVITWTGRDSSGYGIYAQRYNAAGVAQGSETQVNTYTLSSQDNSSVAIVKTGVAAGDYIVTWTSLGQSNLKDVFFQRYNASGLAQGSETAVNQYTTSNQQDVSVSVGENGNFVVTWSSLDQDGDLQGVYARQFDASGVPLGNEFRVNTTTSGNQQNPTVSLDKNGDFIITWTSFGQDGGGAGVYAQRYSAAGVPQGGEFLVNTTTNQDQRNSTVALDEDGDAVITWMGKDTNANGIFAQVYKSSELPSTSGIADVTQPQSAPDYQVDLWAAFSDVKTPDANLTYTLVSPAFNPGFFSTFPPTINPATGKLVLDFNPNGVGSDILTVRATDADGFYVETSFNVTVTAVNDAPIVTIASGTTAYTENAIGGVAIDPNLTLSDPDNTTLASATVTLTNYVVGEDALNFTDQSGITGNFNSATGVLTLSGSALLTDYQAALQSVTYTNSSDNPTTTSRIVQFKVNDGALESNTPTRTVTVTAVNDAPTVTISSGNTTYTEANPPVAIDSTLILTDPDSTNIAGATVTIVNNVVGEDQLAFTTQNGITGSFSNGVLTLTGSATVSNYQTALQSITYQNTSGTPDTTDRTVRFQVTDGLLSSNLGDRTVKVTPINAAPVIAVSSGTVTYIENATGVAIDNALAVSDSDSPNLKGATVQISSNYVNGQDLLTFNNQLGITSVFDASTGKLTLTGTTTVANYQTALKSVQYSNSSDNPSPLNRTIQFQVDDGFAVSNLGSRTLAVTTVNDLPVVTLPSSPAPYTENGLGTAIDLGLTIADPDNLTLTGATVSITNFVAGQDQLNFSPQNGITVSSFAGGVLALTGTTSLTNYQTALRSVTYSNSSDNPTTTNRTIQFQVNDGTALSNSPIQTVTVTAVNDAPVITTAASTVTYTENSLGTTIDTGLTIADPDNLNLTGATVSITNFVAGQDLLNFSPQNGITVSSFTGGVLALTGTTSLSNYQTALRSVTYSNSSDNPTTASRTIQFQVNDGTALSNIGSDTVAINAINDAPSVTGSASPVTYTEGTIPIAIAAGATISDVDSPNLSSATVRITNFVAGEDLLNFTNQNGIISSFSNGVLTLSGTTTLANYQTALRSVTYRNSSNIPNTTDRTLQYSVNDGGLDSNQGIVTVQVIAANDLPVIVTSSGTVSYTENVTGQVIDSGVTLSDTDGTTLVSATITIANYVAGQDFLSFTNQSGITGNFDQTVGVLNLTGTASIATYQTVLRSITYTNSSDNPNSVNRTLQFRVNDGISDSNLSSRAVVVVAVNDAPSLTFSSGAITYVENDPGLAIDSGLLITDLDNTTLTGATVQISGNYVSGQDFLNFTTQNGITGSFNATNGTLTLTGTTTLANYQAALQSVTYFNNSDAPDITDRTIQFQVNDGANLNNLSNFSSRTIQVTATPEAPIIQISNGSLLYREGDSAQPIDSGVVLSDLDSTTLVGATVSVSNYVSGQDIIGFADQNGIAGSFDVATGILTLTGNASIADYQTVLQSVTYANTNPDPNTIDRIVQFQVDDGGLTSNKGSRTIQLTAINSPPVVATSSVPTTYTENNLGISIDSRITLTDPDSLTLAKATVQIANFFAGQDQLNFISQNGISGNFTNGVLTLTGGAAIADYQAALRSITYSNTSDNPNLTDRIFNFQVNDGGVDSNIASRSISVTAVNDAPVVATSAGFATYTESATASVIDAGLSLSDVDSSNVVSGTVSISNFVFGEDILSFTNQNGITGSFNATSGVLTLTGVTTIANYQTALRSVTYANKSTNPSLNDRTIAFAVNDSALTSNPGNRTVKIVPLNSPPIITASSGTAAYTENDPGVVIDSGIVLNDPDSLNLVSATVRISNFVAGQDSLSFANQNGITGSFDPTTGTFSLTGTATVAAYQTALRSITYANSSDTPNLIDRTIQFQVNDGGYASNISSRAVVLTAVNDAPVITPSTGTVTYTENSAAIALDTGLVLSDPDSTNLDSAKIGIVNFVVGQDRLNFVAQNGITGNFDPITGVLSLTGNTSIANYQTALRSITYLNSSNAPDSTDRVIQFQVGEGSVNSAIATRSIKIAAVNNAPGVAVSVGTTTYTENSAGAAIDTGLTLSDPDSPTLRSATVRITNFVTGQDQLNFTNQNGIVGSFNNITGTLTLSGADLPGSYQAALRSVTYTNSSDNPTTTDRTLQFQVNDGQLDSNIATRTLQVLATNDAPIVTSSGSLFDFTPKFGAVLVDAGILVSDPDSTNLVKAKVSINGYVQNQDILSFVDQNGISGSFDSATGTLTLTGTVSIAIYQNALRSITYNNTSLTPDLATRTIEIQVNDSSVDSNVATRSIQITANNNPPILDLNGSDPGTGFTTTFIPNGAPLRIGDIDLSLTDVDSSTMTSAVVSITNPLDGIAERLDAVTAGTGIAADYNLAGRLTLIGTAPRSVYQQVLRSVTYRNSSANPDPTTRSIVFTVNDGNYASELATSTVNIRSNNPTPTSTSSVSLITTIAQDVINAPSSNDTVNSTLENLQQNDLIDGGLGRDTFVLSNGTGAAVVDVGSNINQITGVTPEGTIVLNFEQFDFSRFNGNVAITGSDVLDNKLFGGTGDDVIAGGSGNDLLKGNAGNDAIDGGAGDDTLIGDAGNDILNGGTGSNTLIGGEEDDLYEIETSKNLVVEAANAGIDTIQSVVDYSLGVNLENLTLTGKAIVGTGNVLDNTLTGNALNNTLDGGEGNDVLTGNNGNDILIGGIGNDRLVGSAGRDTLTGGQGKDGFYLTAARGSRDTITDFNSKDDTIFVARSGFSQKLKLGKIRRNQIQLGNAANDGRDRFIYNQGTGALYFDIDGSGKRAKIQIATITNRTVLSNTDIVILGN